MEAAITGQLMFTVGANSDLRLTGKSVYDRVLEWVLTLHYGTSEPTLQLEFGGQENQLINIEVD
jgi:hypothetical protein